MPFVDHFKDNICRALVFFSEYGTLFAHMPITRSAKKTKRADERKRVFNIRRKRAMKEAVKEVVQVIGTTGKDAAAKLVQAYKAIDKAAKRGVIKANTAARKKSRLTKALAKTGESK